MIFESITPIKLYKKQPKIVLPKGSPVGIGNAVFLLAPSRDEAVMSLQSTFMDYTSSLYKKYYIDLVYKERVGVKNCSFNNTGIFQKEFDKTEFVSNLDMILPSEKKAQLKKSHNVLVNLGEWDRLYFAYSRTASVKMKADNFIDFLYRKIFDDSFEGYKKNIVIDMYQWCGLHQNTIGIEMGDMTNPISILLYFAKKAPEAIYSRFKDTTFTIIDSRYGDFLVIPAEMFIKKEESAIYSNISNMAKGKVYKVTSTDESPTSVNTTVPDQINNPSDIIVPGTSVELDKKRQDLLSKMKKNLFGSTNDITDSLEDSDETIIRSDEEDADIDAVYNEYLDENPDILNSMDEAAIINELTSVVKKKVYQAKFTPDRTLKQIAKNDALDASHKEIIKEESFASMESKIIDESDFSDVVSTSNPNIVKSKFVNFDKSYNEKKLMADIDASVGALANVTNKLFVVDKQEEDTSDSLNIKKTLTYTLQDEAGKKHTLKFDMPVIIDNNYVFLNGSMKLMQHQFVLLPIVKTKKDEVVLATNYKKMYITVNGKNDFRVMQLVKYLQKNAKEYNVVAGNNVVLNSDIMTTKDFDGIARKIHSFKIGYAVFITGNIELKKAMNSNGVKYANIDETKYLIIGYDEKSKTPIYIDIIKDSISDKIMSYFPDDVKGKISNIKKVTGINSLMYSRVKLMGKFIPLAYFMMYCEGFTSVMKKSGIEYEFIERTDAKKVDLYTYGLTETLDGYIKWKRYPAENSLFMNGLNILNTAAYTYAELDSKDTYIDMMSLFYNEKNMAWNLDQFKDFMADPISKEVLQDYNLPTELPDLLLYANKWLVDNTYKIESDMTNMRIRSNELLAYHSYNAVADAYNAWKKKTTPKITVKRECVLRNLKLSSVSEDQSTLNPVLEISKLHGITYKGEGGINKDGAITLKKRAYNESMLGVIGITTSPDSNVGVARMMTMEPNLTSTRGYIQYSGLEHVDELSGAQLLTPAELLTPLGVQHDDPARTAMAYKQTMYMLTTNDADPVMIGNGVEKVLPQHLSNSLTVVAKEDGKVVDIKDGYVVIQYKSGEYQTIDTNKQTKRNSASGFWVFLKLDCQKKIGDKVKKGEVVAWSDKAFTKNVNDHSASMNLGALLKIAIIPEWDIYEDSAPISKRASKKLSTSMGMDVEVTLDKGASVDFMVKVGDKVNAGDILIRYDDTPKDEDIADLFNNLRGNLNDEQMGSMVEANSRTTKTHYTGVITKIDIQSTVETNELSSSLKPIVESYYEKINTKNSLLDKYKNPNDVAFYKSGQIISDIAAPVKPDEQGRVKGSKISPNGGVRIVFYVEYEDVMSKGDKLSSEFALKSINSHVIEEGLEPYGELHPDEPIDLIVAPLSISARKTPSIFIAMFGNKCIIEAKRHLADYWKNN